MDMFPFAEGPAGPDQKYQKVSLVENGVEKTFLIPMIPDMKEPPPSIVETDDDVIYVDETFTQDTIVSDDEEIEQDKEDVKTFSIQGMFPSTVKCPLKTRGKSIVPSSSRRKNMDQLLSSLPRLSPRKRYPFPSTSSSSPKAKDNNKSPSTSDCEAQNYLEGILDQASNCHASKAHLDESAKYLTQILDQASNRFSQISSRPAPDQQVDVVVSDSESTGQNSLTGIDSNGTDTSFDTADSPPASKLSFRRVPKDIPREKESATRNLFTPIAPRLFLPTKPVLTNCLTNKHEKGKLSTPGRLTPRLVQPHAQHSGQTSALGHAPQVANFDHTRTTSAVTSAQGQSPQSPAPPVRQLFSPSQNVHPHIQKVVSERVSPPSLEQTWQGSEKPSVFMESAGVSNKESPTDRIPSGRPLIGLSNVVENIGAHSPRVEVRQAAVPVKFVRESQDTAPFTVNAVQKTTVQWGLKHKQRIMRICTVNGSVVIPDSKHTEAVILHTSKGKILLLKDGTMHPLLKEQDSRNKQNTETIPAVPSGVSTVTGQSSESCQKSVFGVHSLSPCKHSTGRQLLPTYLPSVGNKHQRSVTSVKTPTGDVHAAGAVPLKVTTSDWKEAAQAQPAVTSFASTKSASTCNHAENYDARALNMLKMHTIHSSVTNVSNRSQQQALDQQQTVIPAEISNSPDTLPPGINSTVYGQPMMASVKNAALALRCPVPLFSTSFSSSIQSRPLLATPILKPSVVVGKSASQPIIGTSPVVASNTVNAMPVSVNNILTTNVVTTGNAPSIQSAGSQMVLQASGPNITNNVLLFSGALQSGSTFLTSGIQNGGGLRPILVPLAQGGNQPIQTPVLPHMPNVGLASGLNQVNTGVVIQNVQCSPGLQTTIATPKAPETIQGGNGHQTMQQMALAAKPGITLPAHARLLGNASLCHTGGQQQNVPMMGANTGSREQAPQNPGIVITNVRSEKPVNMHPGNANKARCIPVAMVPGGNDKAGRTQLSPVHHVHPICKAGDHKMTYMTKVGATTRFVSTIKKKTDDGHNSAIVLAAESFQDSAVTLTPPRTDNTCASPETVCAGGGNDEGAAGTSPASMPPAMPTLDNTGTALSVNTGCDSPHFRYNHENLGRIPTILPPKKASQKSASGQSERIGLPLKYVRLLPKPASPPGPPPDIAIPRKCRKVTVRKMPYLMPGKDYKVPQQTGAGQQFTVCSQSITEERSHIEAVPKKKRGRKRKNQEEAKITWSLKPGCLQILPQLKPDPDVLSSGCNETITTPTNRLQPAIQDDETTPCPVKEECGSEDDSSSLSIGNSAERMETDEVEGSEEDMACDGQDILIILKPCSVRLHRLKLGGRSTVKLSECNFQDDRKRTGENGSAVPWSKKPNALQYQFKKDGFGKILGTSGNHGHKINRIDVWLPRLGDLFDEPPELKMEPAYSNMGSASHVNNSRPPVLQCQKDFDFQ